jgi:hypothetical protein
MASYNLNKEIGMNTHYVKGEKGKILVMVASNDDLFTRLGESPSIPIDDDELESLQAVVVKLRHRKVALFQDAKIIRRKGFLKKGERHFAIHEWKASGDAAEKWVTKFYNDFKDGKLKRSE